jgi:uncharacterized membrane protein
MVIALVALFLTGQRWIYISLMVTALGVLAVFTIFDSRRSALVLTTRQQKRNWRIGLSLLVILALISLLWGRQ